MPTASAVQTSFISGEWSKAAQGRMADPRYRSGMSRCLNIIPTEEQSAPRRPGTKLLATTREGAAARLMPFVVDASNPYTAEFSDGHVRFLQDDVWVTADGGAISDISTATPAVLTLTGAVDWVTDDQIQFTLNDDTARGTSPLLGNRQFRVTKLTTTTFTLHDGATGAPVDGAVIAWTSALDISVARVVDLDTVFTNGEWEDARLVQADLNGVPQGVVLAGVEPQVITATLNEGGYATFEIAEADIEDGPYLDPFPGSWATPDTTDGIINLALSFQTYDSAKAYSIGDYVSYSNASWRSTADDNQNHTPSVGSAYWTPASPGDVIGENGFTVDDVGRHIRLFSEPPLWATGTSYTTGNVVKFNGTYWTALTNMTGATPSAGNINPNQPGNLTTTWAVNAAASRWTWGKVTGLSTTGLISQTISGVANIGDMTLDGGLAAAFDGNQDQNTPAAARSQDFGTYCYLGRNYTTPGAQSCSSARVYPAGSISATQGGLFIRDGNYALGGVFEVRLYGKSTSPASATDGTLLSTVDVTTVVNVPYTSPITLVSSNNTTTYNYLWITLVLVSGGFDGGDEYAAIGEVEFYSAAGVAGGGVTVQIIGDPLLYTSTIKTWRLGLYNNSTPSWPTRGTYHEGRLWLGGAFKNRFDGSMSNEPFKFSPTGADGTVADNNAISYTLNRSEKNDIEWMTSIDQGIVIGTAGGPWLIHASEANNPLTPTSIQAHSLPRHESAAVEPVTTGPSTLFVQKEARKLLEFLPDGQAGRFFARNLSEFAKHMTVSGIAELAYQEEAAPIVWARMTNGALRGMTYRRINLVSADPPEASGWHRHELGSGRGVESICSGRSVLMVTNDPDTNIRHIEKLTDFPEEGASIFSSWYVDSGVVPTAGVSYSSDAGIKFHGLWNHNGKTVDVFAAGLDLGSFAVVDGIVTVPYTSLFTKRYVEQLSATGEDWGDLAVPIDSGQVGTIPVVVGFSYTSQGQLLRPVAPDATGAANGPGFGKTKRTHQFAVLLESAQKISFGTKFTALRPANFKTPGGIAYTPTELFSGIYQGTLDDDYGLDSQLCWEVSRPFPATVLALGPFIATQDR